MDMFQFVRDVAVSLDTLTRNSFVEPLAPKRRMRWFSRVRPVDMHCAFVRVLYELLPVERAYELIPREFMLEPRAIAAQMYVALSHRKVGSLKHMQRWQNSKEFCLVLCKVFVRFLHLLEFDVRLSYSTQELARLKRDVNQLRASGSSQSCNALWGTLMSTPERVVCVANGLRHVPTDDRKEKLLQIKQDATQGSLPLPSEFAQIVDRHTALFMVN